MNRLAICVSVVLLFVASTVWGQVQYTVTDLGTLPGYAASYANGINKSGQVVGYAEDSGGYQHAFLSSGGTMTDLGVLADGYQYSVAQSINDSGLVVGSSAISLAGIGGQERPIISNGGTMTSLGSLGGGYGYGMGINKLGQAIGVSLRGDGSTTAPFLYSGGGMTDLGNFAGGYSVAYGINDDTQIVGSSSGGPNAVRGFIWQDGVYTDLGDLQNGSGQTQAYAINNSAQVVGEATASGSPVGRAFFWQHGVIANIGVLPGNDSSRAFAINSRGVVVGDSFSGWMMSMNAFVWNNTDGMQNLNGMLDSSGTGWTLQSARGINASGQICGYGTNPSGQTHAFLLTPTPEPSMFALLAAGAVGLAGYGLRRRSVARRLAKSAALDQPQDDEAPILAFASHSFDHATVQRRAA